MKTRLAFLMGVVVGIALLLAAGGYGGYRWAQASQPPMPVEIQSPLSGDGAVRVRESNVDFDTGSIRVRPDQSKVGAFSDRLFVTTQHVNANTGGQFSVAGCTELVVVAYGVPWRDTVVRIKVGDEHTPEGALYPLLNHTITAGAADLSTSADVTVWKVLSPIAYVNIFVNVDDAAAPAATLFCIPR